MNMLKKLGIPVYIGAFAFVMSLLGLIFTCVSNGVPGYGIDNFGTAIALAVFSLILILATCAANAKFGGQSLISAVLRVASIVLTTAVVAVLILSRAVLYASLSTFDANEVARSAFNSSLTAMIFFLIAAVAVIVTAFFEGKKVKAQE